MGRIAVRVPYETRVFRVPYPDMHLIKIVDLPMEEVSYAIIDGDTLPVWNQGVHPYHVTWDEFHNREAMDKKLKFSPKGPSQ